MEMDSLPTLDHTRTAEPDLPGAPPSYRDAQVWKDLKAETGFASCADYLEYYNDVRTLFEFLLKQFQQLPEDLATAENAMVSRRNLTTLNEMPAAYQTWITIYDLSHQEDLPISLSLRRNRHSGTELIQALREPPDNVGVQLVFWSFQAESLNQEMVDALVLGLKLDPQLLRDYENIQHMGSHLPSRGFRSSQINRVEGKGIITTLSQNYMPGKANAVPVLLVACDSLAPEVGDLRNESLIGGDSGNPHIYRPALREKKGYRAMKKYHRRPQAYARAVESFIERDRLATPSKAFLLLAATSPLLYTEAYRVREVSSEVRETYDEVTSARINGRDTSDTDYKGLDQDLDRMRLELRWTLEVAEDRVSRLFRYLGSKAHLDWSKERS